MRDGDVEAIQLQLGHPGAAVANVEAVGVSVHRGYRCEYFEFGEQIEAADVAAVKNVIHLTEDVEDFVGELAVCVGDDAEPHLRATLPTGHECDVQLHVVDDALYHEVHELADVGRPVIEPGRRGNHRRSGFRHGREIAEVYQREWCFAGHENQRPAFFERDISRSFDQ